MNSNRVKFLCGLALVFCAQVSHAQVPVVDPINMSEDDKLGCTILLCLANPKGPKAEPQCQPPINELARRMAKFWKKPAIPKCPSTENEGTKFTLEQAKYDACPAGYDAVDKGALVYITSSEGAQKLIEADKDGTLTTIDPVDGRFVTGIGEGDDIPSFQSIEDGNPPNKICVKNVVGTFTFKDVTETKTAYLFEDTIEIKAPEAPLKYKVFIKNKLFKEGALN